MRLINPKKKVIYLIGSTAVGKSKLAVKLAKKISAQIISCDSMQVYKSMEILTALPSKILRKKVPHYLVDMISPEKEYNVARYQRQAIKLIKKIQHRDKIPLFVGGSGLYMSAVLDGLFPQKSVDRVLRRRLYKEAEIKGNQYLYQQLKKVDPKIVAKIHPNDLRRIIRALEVYYTTHIAISKLQSKRKGILEDYDVKIFGLNLPRQELYENIDERVEQMFRQGVIKEVKNLLKIRLSKTARQAIGIKEIKGFLDGQYSLLEAKRLMKRNSRHYAKRQLTWFRKDNRIKWLDAGNLDKALNQILYSLRGNINYNSKNI